MVPQRGRQHTTEKNCKFIFPAKLGIPWPTLGKPARVFDHKGARRPDRLTQSASPSGGLPRIRHLVSELRHQNIYGLTPGHFSDRYGAASHHPSKGGRAAPLLRAAFAARLLSFFQTARLLRKFWTRSNCICRCAWSLCCVLGIFVFCNFFYSQRAQPCGSGHAK